MGYVPKRNLDARVRKIAHEKNLPLVTVRTVAKALLDDYQHDIIVNRDDVLIEGITSLGVLYDMTKDEYTVRGRVSNALRTKLKDFDKETRKEAVEV